MRYMDIEGHIYNAYGCWYVDIIKRVFIKKSTYQMTINKGENDQNSRCPCKLYENSLISSLSLLVKNFEEEIQPSKDYVHTVTG